MMKYVWLIAFQSEPNPPVRSLIQADKVAVLLATGCFALAPP